MVKVTLRSLATSTFSGAYTTSYSSFTELCVYQNFRGTTSYLLKVANFSYSRVFGAPISGYFIEISQRRLA